MREEGAPFDVSTKMHKLNPNKNNRLLNGVIDKNKNKTEKFFC